MENKIEVKKKNPIHPELFTYFKDKAGWKAQFLRPELLSKKWDMYVMEELPNIYTIPAFTEDFCDYIIDEAESCNCWTVDRHEHYPTTDMVLQTLGFQDIYQDILEEYIWPMAKHVYMLEEDSWLKMRSENFLDQGLFKEGEAYAKQISEALNKGADVREITWVQNGVTMKGLGERTSANQPYKPISIALGVPQDVPDAQAGMELPAATPPGQADAGPGVLPAKGEIAAAQGQMPQGQVLAAAPVAQTNMSFRTIEKDGKKILVRANPNTGEMIEMTDKEGKPIAVSDEKQTKEKYFRDAMAAYDAGNTDEAIIMANAANMGGLFGTTVTINDLERTFGRPPGTKTQAEEPAAEEQPAQPTVGNPKFPLKVIRNGVPATVYDQNQLNQAIEEGFFPAE